MHGQPHISGICYILLFSPLLSHDFVIRPCLTVQYTSQTTNLSLRYFVLSLLSKQIRTYSWSSLAGDCSPRIPRILWNPKLHFHKPNTIFRKAQQSPVDQGLPIIEASQPHSDTPHSVGTLWTGDRPDAETST